MEKDTRRLANQLIPRVPEEFRREWVEVGDDAIPGQGNAGLRRVEDQALAPERLLVRARQFDGLSWCAGFPGSYPAGPPKAPSKPVRTRSPR